MGLVLMTLVGYLVGSIPSGLLVSKLSRGIDLRQYGSGSTGATNTLRILGLRASAVVLGGDLLKGFLVVLLARYSLGSTSAEVLAALAAILGHNWPIFARFKGGRGVATGLGGLFAMLPWVGLACVAVFLAAIALFRYASLGSLMGVLTALLLTAVLVLWGQNPAEYLLYGLLGAPLIVFQHRENIARLLSGKESRLWG